MATIINADTSDGLKITSDASGEIQFQSGGVTKAGVNATGLTGDGSQLTGLPAGYTDADALTLFNASGSAPVYACRAWVNFNGTGTVAIRASGNVSSITDNGTGDYTVNFTTAMSDVNYAPVGTGENVSGGTMISGISGVAPTTLAFRFYCITSAAALTDPVRVNVAIFR
jgi:hypothetical protein